MQDIEITINHCFNEMCNAMSSVLHVYCSGCPYFYYSKDREGKELNCFEIYRRKVLDRISQSSNNEK